MVQSLQANNSSRIFFALPELLDSQRDSFNDFLKQGISKEFSKLSPIRVESKNIIAELHLDGEDYQLISPTETPRECILKMKTYDCKLYIKYKIVYKTFSGTILHKTKSEWVLVGHLPLMTRRGHFIINGSPRVIVQQVVRCPGIYFQETAEKDFQKKSRFYADIIPKRGVWLRVQITKKGEIQVKFKKGKKIQAEILQKCLQIIERQEKLKSLVSDTENFIDVFSEPENWIVTSVLERGISRNLRNACVKKQICLNEVCIMRKRKQAECTTQDLLFASTYDKLYRPTEDKEREQVALKNNIDASDSKWQKPSASKDARWQKPSASIDATFKSQKCYTNLFSTFKIESRYDLSDLGRQKINKKFGISLSETQLTALDLQVTRYWLQKYSKGEKRVDDIDHSKNRRIRTSGSLLQSQFENGIDRLKKFTWNKFKEFINVQLIEADSLEIGKNQVFCDYNNKIVCARTTFLHKKVGFFVQERSSCNVVAAFAATTGQCKNECFCTLPARTKLLQHCKNYVFAKQLQRLQKLGKKNSLQQLLLLCAKTTFLQKPLFCKKNWQFFLQQQQQQSCCSHNKLQQKSTKKEKVTNSASFLSRKIEYSLKKKENITLKNVVSAKPITGAFREFFGSNPLSQYMDQTNPLAEITHKRRISSLGIGGVSRDSAGMAIRGIHATHYGRICPIETPEGKNAGLVNSLSFFTKVDSHGFLKTPYYKLCKGQVQNELGFAFFSAEEETASHFCIAPSDLQKSCHNILQNNSVAVRVADHLLDLFKKIHPSDVDCIGISPIQMISVATALIPFLEHNDANRALMGSNMQRQAVPLMIPERPLIGTGLESLVLAESGHITESKVTGFISYVSCHKIIVESLKKFRKESHRFSVAYGQRKFAGVTTTATVVNAMLLLQKQLGSFPSFSTKTTFLQSATASCCHETAIVAKNASFSAKTTFLQSKKKRMFFLQQQQRLQKLLCNSFAVVQTAKLFLGQKHSFLLQKTGVFLGKNVVFARTTAVAKLRFAQLLQGCNNTNNNEVVALCISGANAFTTKNDSFCTSCNDNANIKTKLISKRNKKQIKKALAKQRVEQKKFFPKLDIGKTRKKRLLSSYKYKYIATQLSYISECYCKCISVANAKVLVQVVDPLQELRSCLKNKKTRQGRKYEFTSCTHAIQNFNRSNQDICLVERALAQEGEWVQQGDVLTDCSASEKGELAVGKNVLLAYLPWEGYNFEDAIVISDRLVKENVYTSLHIERYDFDAQDFKEGVSSQPGVSLKQGVSANEWFTNDLPGIASKNVKHLNEFGLSKIGSFVKEGDILVGKMKYSNKKATTPYERLLCDILGEKNFAARDASLYLPRGVEARVIHHQLLGSFALLQSNKAKHKNSTFHSKKQFESATTPDGLLGQQHLKMPDGIRHQHLKMLPAKNKCTKVVNIFLGEKRPIQVGDKMSGRHGNKGVVSTILPRQDMPYLADGTPIDIILNPLGVPSRMNVGQVFECLLGLAATYLSQHFKITPFDESSGIEASQSLIYLKLYQARLQSGQNWLFQVDFPGKTQLIDGRSGETFDQWVTVGRAYMLKLIHMVNEKIHARSTGPYALITQQPLRGRSQKGGQRLGEMEVWALQGFGAAYTLQELLTKKSDDSIGRKEIAASILPRPVSILETVLVSDTFAERKDYSAEKSLGNSGMFTDGLHPSATLQVAGSKEGEKLLLGQPEIFKVLVCELQALCLDIGLYTLTNQSFQRSFITTLY